MITIRVDVATGHYRVPGQVPIQASTYPIAPPSTIQGFLESLVGSESGEFKGRFAYGWLHRPEGHGTLFRRAHVWSTAGLKNVATGRPDRHGEVTRVIHVPTFFNLSYCVRVAGEWESRVRHVLGGGNVERYGILSLGESGDVVTWLAEYTGDEPVEWIVPAAGPMVLPVKTGRGWDNMTPILKSFKYNNEPEWVISQ